MKKRIKWYQLAVVLTAAGTTALGASGSFGGFSTTAGQPIASLGTLTAKPVIQAIEPISRCLAHCAIRTVQETRAWCEVGDTPAHIGGWQNAWITHEETVLVEEEIYIDSNCNETVIRRTEIPLPGPIYWPEDDIFNPVPYYKSELAAFECGDQMYDSDTNRTELFVYRIVVDYEFGRCQW